MKENQKESSGAANETEAVISQPQALIKTDVTYDRTYRKDEDGITEQVNLASHSTINQTTGVNEVTHESWVTLKLTKAAGDDCACNNTELTIHEKSDIKYQEGINAQ
jgi:hypothetical protein